jgi:hypothetical protein
MSTCRLTLQMSTRQVKVCWVEGGEAVSVDEADEEDVVDEAERKADDRGVVVVMYIAGMAQSCSYMTCSLGRCSCCEAIAAGTIPSGMEITSEMT